MNGWTYEYIKSMSFLEQHFALMGVLEVLELENGKSKPSEENVDVITDNRKLRGAYDTRGMQLPRKPNPATEGLVYSPLTGWVKPEEFATVEIPKVTQ